MPKLYEQLARTLMALRNCQAHDDNRTHWDAMEDMHSDRIEKLCKDYLPSGSGFDSGSILQPESTPDKLMIRADFHHMDENGFYCGWSEHTVIVRASLAFGFELRITGPNRRGIKDYISDTFHYALNTVIPD